jgi:hypothetical protein
MKGLFIKILAVLILLSFAADSTMQVWDTYKTELKTVHEKEDSEKKTEEEKVEKETEKDKINYFFRHHIHDGLTIKYYKRNLSIVTSAYLSLPEIPPDQA